MKDWGPIRKLLYVARSANAHQSAAQCSVSRFSLYLF